MVKIKIPKNNTNNEATVNQKAKSNESLFFDKRLLLKKNNKPRQHLTCRFAAGKNITKRIMWATTYNTSITHVSNTVVKSY